MALTALEEAFKKSGLVPAAEIDAREQKRLDDIKEAKKEEQRKEKERQQQNEAASEEFLKKMKPFDDIWAGEKSHKFLAHIVHAFSPFNKGQFALEKSDLKTNNCCICRCKLISKAHLFEHIPEIANVSLEQIRKEINGEITPEQKQKELMAITGGAVLGVVSEESNAAFCSPCWENFSEWIMHQILRGNREINNIAAKLKRAQTE